METDQVTGMAMDYTTGTMYGLTLSGKLVTIDLDNGAVTEIAATSEKVTALAIDKRGVLYAAGSTAIGVEAKLYTVDPKTPSSWISRALRLAPAAPTTAACPTTHR